MMNFILISVTLTLVGQHCHATVGSEMWAQPQLNSEHDIMRRQAAEAWNADQVCGDYPKLSFSDIEYSLLGYNSLIGYPLEFGLDPGFTLPIFEANYTNTVPTADCRYIIPKGFQIIKDVSCMTSFSNSEVKSESDLQKHIAASAEISGSGWGASFSASAKYNSDANSVSSGDKVVIMSKADCRQHFTALDDQNLPPLHPVFVNAIKKLATETKDEPFMEFFDTYGTHFITYVDYGARLQYQHTMDTSYYNSQKNSDVSISAQASYSGIVSVSGGFSLDKSQKEAASKFQKNVKTSIVSVGAPPSANSDPATWAATVRENPLPMKYKMSSMENLFTNDFMTQFAVLSTTHSNHIHTKITALRGKYCEHLKRKKGLGLVHC